MLSTTRVAFFASIIVVLNCLHISFVLSGENVIRGRRFICGTHDPDLITVNCSFKRLNRTTEYWTFNVDYRQPIKNLHINITNFTQQQNLEYKPHMIINFHVDSCKWVDGTLPNGLMDIIKNDMKKYGNSFTPCPQYGLVYMRNMTFHADKYPPITPSGFNYLDFQFYTYIRGETRLLYFLRPYLEIKYKGINYW